MIRDTLTFPICNNITSRTFNKLIVFVLLFGLLFPISVFSQVMESTSYQMQFDSINVGGGLSASTNYTLEDTTGEVGTGRLTSTSYILRAGFQQFDEVVILPSVPPTEEVEGGGGLIEGILGKIQILNITVSVKSTSAIITWSTNHSAISKISWGKTTEYEAGTIENNLLSQEHMAFMENLSPDTVYYFELEVNDFTTGLQGFRSTFSTFPEDDFTPPASVSNFQAVGIDETIELSWNNPIDEDFDAVRLVRSDHFFPENPFDGKVVYEGVGTRVVDTNVEVGVTYYYSVFTRDRSGNYSAGSIALGQAPGKGKPPKIIIDPFSEFPDSLEVHPQLKDLTLRDFDFIQDGRKIIPSLKGRILVDGAKNLTISIDYVKLPEVLKSIGFTFVNPRNENKTFSILLRVNEEKTTYSATIAPFVRGGVYDLSVRILDHKNQGIKRLQGDLFVAAALLGLDLDALGILQLLLLLLLLILILITIRRLLDKERREVFASKHGRAHNFFHNSRLLDLWKRRIKKIFAGDDITSGQ